MAATTGLLRFEPRLEIVAGEQAVKLFLAEDSFWGE